MSGLNAAVTFINLSLFSFHRYLAWFQNHMTTLARIFIIILNRWKLGCLWCNLLWHILLKVFVFNTFRDASTNEISSITGSTLVLLSDQSKVLHVDQERWRTQCEAAYPTPSSSTPPPKPGLATPSDLHSVTCPSLQSPGWRARLTAIRRGGSNFVKRIGKDMIAAQEWQEPLIIRFLLERSHCEHFFSPLIRLKEKLIMVI